MQTVLKLELGYAKKTEEIFNLFSKYIVKYSCDNIQPIAVSKRQTFAMIFIVNNWKL